MTTTYQPALDGGWIALAREQVTLVVDPGENPDGLLADLWAITGDPLRPILDRLTRDGLSSTPRFALVEWADDARARVIVRGDIRVTVTDDAGEHVLAGTGVSTWAERTFPGAGSALVVVQGATAAPLSLPLSAGMAFAATVSVSVSVSVSMTERPAPSVPPVPAMEPEPEPEPAPEPAPAPEPEPDPAPAPEPAPEPASEPIDDSLSEETVVAPARTRSAAVPVAASAPSEQTVASLGDVPGDVPGALPDSDAAAEPAVGDTVFRSVGEDTALPDHAGEVTPGGDHDGETVMTSDIRALRNAQSPSADDQVPVTEPPVADAAEAGPAKSVHLVLPGGEIEQLDRTLLIGRAPSVAQVSGDSMPRLIVLGTGDQDISRNHAQVSLEGGTVVVTDLHSRNGTMVVLPGKSPRKLRAGEPTSVLIGTVIDLGGGITITVGED